VIHIGGPGVRASALGITLGLILSAGALRVMHGVLFGVDVYDMPTIVTVVLILASVTLIATTVPTFRIAGIDPARTLRDE
jgi:ABC-type lipoprotein release transport system permease subunit